MAHFVTAIRLQLCSFFLFFFHARFFTLTRVNECCRRDDHRVPRGWATTWSNSIDRKGNSKLLLKVKTIFFSLSSIFFSILGWRIGIDPNLIEPSLPTTTISINDRSPNCPWTDARDIQIDLPVEFSALLRWPATKDNFVLVEIIIGETIELKLLV